MGNNILTINKLNYEDVNFSIKQNHIIINTLPDSLQDCLILNTLNIKEEENIINNCLKKNKNSIIIIYGKNCTDKSVFTKHQQLIELGFTNVNIYIGGMFEWLLMQDIYGEDEFPTTKRELDILKYKSDSLFN
jgi:rhodanese-related sulfurtransferase|tara:strand:+ start:1177 stop:1575 length:399 start_codon:yes stop_codon:yes gene_type:complete